MTKGSNMPMTWHRTTFERYWEMLEVLPPAVQTGAGFLVGEPWRHDEKNRPMFAAFVCFGDKFDRDQASEYFEADGPMPVTDFRALKREDVLGNLSAVTA